LAAAVDLLREGGLAALTIAAVAERAGVTRPAVYRRFPDAEALAIGVLYAELDNLAMTHLGDVPPSMPILDQLVAFTDPVYRWYLEDAERSMALMQLAMFSRHPTREILDRQARTYLELVAERVVLAQARGELPASTDVQGVVEAFFALYFMVALGGVRGMIPGHAAMLARFRAMMGAHLRGAG
jgi:AcrR family transcriptional regulator